VSTDRRRSLPAHRISLRLVPLLATCTLLGCTTVGPDYQPQESPLTPDWYRAEQLDFATSPENQVRWWQALGDPELDRLITTAHKQNNSLRIAALRVLESRAQLGIAIGAQYPQSQVVAGDAATVRASENSANTAAGDLRFSQFGIGIGASWELDFWGRFRRGIEAADAALLASVADYDQAIILLTAQVCRSYLAIRTLEEQLAITQSNIAIQQRSLDIVNVNFENGSSSELDVLQARTLLLSTQASVPALETSLYQARHALANLLGLPPTDTADLLSKEGTIPALPREVGVGLPADILRQRPDIRRAEYLAMAQNASVGLAAVNLYPSFSIGGSLGLAAAGSTDTTRSGNSGLGQLFRADSLTYSIGPSFVWPFLNYERLENNVRVQDARLQQALVAYRETVIQSAREVEDAMAALDGAVRQDRLLSETVDNARRSAEVAQLRFNEGFSDYQRLLDAQQSLFAQQSRFVSNKSLMIESFIALYLSLGGGWELRYEQELIDADTGDSLRERTNWGDMIETTVDETKSLTPSSRPR
jgi:NodT family efflux transporter outer membrane factor (OMF) lipoprotein